MKNVILVLLGIVACFFSCEKANLETEENIKVDSELVSELKSAPESLTIENNTLVLNTYLWRDFMPIAEENGSKLYAVHKLTEINEQPILSAIILKKQYVIKNDEIWTAEYSQTKTTHPHLLEGYVNNGPKWGPHSEVDVVCEFEHLGVTYRLLAKSQQIHRTD